MVKRCVIIGGADINQYQKIRAAFQTDDFFIYCDSGLKHRPFLEKNPDLIVGDFDSWIDPGIPVKHRDTLEFHKDNYKDPEVAHTYYQKTDFPKTEMLVIPPEKYDTDTMFGVREGIKRGFREFLLIGVIGQRFDHSLANVSILIMLGRMGLKSKILDDYSEMEIISPAAPGMIEDRFSYFSLMNISGTAEGVSIENAKYTYIPNGIIPCDNPFGISNEVLPGNTARVTLEKGELLLIKVWNE